MEMIHSEISGVAFSLNPLNNDHDEAVINSNWGVGETVVSGVVNPDLYIINKIKKMILERKIGKKEFSLYLNTNKFGLEKRENPEISKSKTLSDLQVFDIVENLEKIVQIYQGKPMDIEWGYFEGKLYLLQARPITTSLKLPERLYTLPNEKRQLYLDVSLVIQGTDKTYSILGTNCLYNILDKFGEMVLGSSNVCDIKNSVVEPFGGKIIMNVSNVFTLMPIDKYAENIKMMSKNISEIIKDIMVKEQKNEAILKSDWLITCEKEEEKVKRLCFENYQNPKVPYKMNFSKLGMLWRLPVFKIIFPGLFFNRILTNLNSGIEYFENKLSEIENLWEQKSIKLKLIKDTLFYELAYLFTQCIIPVSFNGILNGQKKIQELFNNKNIEYIENKELNQADNFDIEKLLEKEKFTKEEKSFLIENLSRSLPNNVTTTMGLSLFNLAEILIENNHTNKYIFSDLDVDGFKILFKKANKKYLDEFKPIGKYKKVIELNDNDNTLEINKQLNESDLFDEIFFKEFYNYIDKYGFRGDLEIDIKNPRFRDEQINVVIQIYSFFEGFKNQKKDIDDNIKRNKNPKEIFEEAEKNRPRIYSKLNSLSVNYGFNSEFNKAYNNLIHFMCHRETHKFYLIKALGLIREITIDISQLLLKEKILDKIEDIFDLNLDQIIEIYEVELPLLIKLNNEEDKKIKLSELKRKINDYVEFNYIDKKVFDSWKESPGLFDSRGRILRRDKVFSNNPNEIIGDPVSFGCIKGKAKIMESPNDKKFNNGDILITKATDPGWTPLIINSGAIILEIGGILQHGALVAREFNKPCIVGIENAMKLFKDNEEIEVDANNGIIRKLK